jgi:hypothetical protein
VLIATKLDKIALSKQKPILAKLEKEARRPVLGFSAETGEGRGPLWAALLGAIESPGETGALASSSGVE